MRFFLNYRWTDRTSLIIISALFVLIPVTFAASQDESRDDRKVTNELIRPAEVENEDSDKVRVQMGEQELRFLRGQFIDICEKHERLLSKWELLQASAVGALEKGIAKQPPLTLIKSIKGYESLSNASRKLSVEVNEFCDYLEPILDKLSDGDLDVLRVKYRMDKIRKSSLSVAALSGELPQAVDTKNCRILDINDTLRIVVLTAGSLSGVRNGLAWKVDGNESVTLRTIAVRPFLSVAIVSEGDIKKLAPGMKVLFHK